MSELAAIRQQAQKLNARVTCPECPFTEDFVDYLDRDDRVDEAAGSIEFGCPECGSETVDLVKERRAEPNTYLVSGLDELEELAGE